MSQPVPPVFHAVCFAVTTMADPQREIERYVRVALERAEEATWTANELVGRTLESAVSGKEAATTLHHAYSAQVHLARVQDWAREWIRAQEEASQRSAPPKFDLWLSWMRRAQSHAEKLCRCFPPSKNAAHDAPGIAEWAKRWPQDDLQAKGRAERSLETIEIAIEVIEQRSSMGVID
jgi:hypothetical protein